MWYFRSPKIVFGDGALAELDQISGKRAFIVTDEVLTSLGFLQQVQDQLAEVGTDSTFFDRVEADPGLQTVEHCAQAMLAYGPDWIIGLGGGSCLDVAKAAWFRYERPDISLEEVSPFEQFDLRSKAGFITIPTTAGSGAEVTAGAVITDERANRKMEVATYEFTPDLAIIDPQFSAQMPPELTADTGIDVLAHAVEGVANTFANDFSDGLCLHAFRMIFEYLPRAYLHGSKDMEARTKMANAATIATLLSPMV
jgi:alcohol dehydrogenase class IV